MVSLIVFLLGPLSIATLAHAASSHESLVYDFLGVTGINMNTSRISSFNEFTDGMPDSSHLVTDIRAEVGAGNALFDVGIYLMDGKLWYYSMSGNFSTGELNKSALLVRAENILRAYQTFSNESYCSEFVSLLSAAMQAQNSSVENEDLALRISSGKGGVNNAVSLDYSPKVGGCTFMGEWFGMSMSKNGLLTDLCDNTRYRVGTTDINVTEGEAIAKATPYATTYARLHRQTITATNVTLELVIGNARYRDDDFVMYPEWDVYFTFDKMNNESVFGYDVGIWADNGQVYYSAPQGIEGQGSVGGSLSWSSAATVLAIVATAAFLPALCVYVKNKAKNRRNHA
jgi:hypothetical protein